MPSSWALHAKLVALHAKLIALHAKHQQTLLLTLPFSDQVFLVATVPGPREPAPCAAADLPRDVHVSKSSSEVFHSKILYSPLLFINLYQSANSIFKYKVKALS